MKKRVLFTLVLFMLTVVLVGCGSKGLVGSWKSDSFSGAYVYTFNADGTGNYDAAGTKKEFTYKTEEDKISILYTGDTVPFESTYKIDGNKLNIVDSLGNDTFYTKK